MKDNNENKTLEQLRAELEQAQKVCGDIQKNIAQKETEEANRKKAELNAQKNKRKKEIEEAAKHYQTLIKEFIKDYGSYTANYSIDNNDEIDTLSFLFGSKPWKFFL